MKYPDQYLHVQCCGDGKEFIVPLRGNASLDLRHQLKRWIAREFGGERILDGQLMSGLEGQYYARIMTDGRPPDSVICWQSGGFYLKDV
jgi:hypothetical protein